MSNKKEKFEACLVVHSIGDTIGYNNGKWEFKNNKNVATYDLALETLFEFIYMGGINELPVKEMNASDDTIFHIGMAECLLQSDSVGKSQIISIKSKFKQLLENILEDGKHKKERGIGITTAKSIEEMDVKSPALLPYNPSGGGSGVAMRSSCIGLVFNQETDLDKLVELSIVAGKITHSNPIGFLGGVVSAYFTHLAYNDVPVEKWGFKLIELLESNKVKKFIDFDNTDEKDDYEYYVDTWKHYVETKFDADGKIIINKTTINIIFKNRFYFGLVSQKKLNSIIGGSGLDSVIVAYDSLLDAKNKWEPFVVYSMLNFGDTDTIGAIAGSWYGACYGFNNITKNCLPNNLEFGEKLMKLADELYNKYAK